MALPMRPSPTIPTRPSTARLTRSVVADCPSATGTAFAAEGSGDASLSFLSIGTLLGNGTLGELKKADHHETFDRSNGHADLLDFRPSLRGLRPAYTGVRR